MKINFNFIDTIPSLWQNKDNTFLPRGHMNAAIPMLSAEAPEISHRVSNDNLHISLAHRFEAPQAQALINLLDAYHRQCKRIFVDVRRIANPHPGAAAALKESYRHKPYSPQQIIFKGDSGFALAVNGNKVLVPSRNPAGQSGGRKPLHRHARVQGAGHMAGYGAGHGLEQTEEHSGRHSGEHGHEHGKGHVCCGKCANCRCGGKKAAKV